MAKHLSSEELERVMAGKAGESAQRHVLECAACAGDVAMLTGVRESAAMVADRQRLLAVMPAVSAGRGWLRGGMWAGAMAAVLVAAIVPVEMMHRSKEPAVTAVVAPKQVAGTTEISDDALLSGVQSDLSSTVPAPLEPLAGTSTTTTSSTTANTKE